MAAEDYTLGDVKQNPDNHAVAVRTALPAGLFADRHWAVMSVDSGGYYASYAQVEAWPDMVRVEAPAEEPEAPEEPEDPPVDPEE